MAYGIELREKIIQFVEKGGSKYKAAEIFGVNRQTIYNWLKREDLKPTLNHTKGYKINEKELEEYLLTNKDAFCYEIAEKFKVSPSAISQKFKIMKITNKKNTKIRRSK